MIMLGRHRPSPSSWACSIRCTRRSTTIDLGEQLTIGPGPFVEPGSASRCRPFPLALSSGHSRLHLRRRSAPFLSPLVTRHGSQALSKEET
jgi:hypothetical protein